MQDDYSPGQRVINDAELQLGLGTVLSVEPRRITVLFMSSGDTRTYAREGSPISRIRFTVGDSLLSHDGLRFVVESVVEEDGLLTYIGRDSHGVEHVLPEGQLDNHIQLNRPGERLLTRQLDEDKWFVLRYISLQQRHRLHHSPIWGLTGSRTSLIPHQLYIAHEVAKRYAPRVLLADEVGLGKTIEAGMVLHQQLLSERAQRVLIIVPESLIHQWLVEMRRRFNLNFTVFDEPRCRAMEQPISDEFGEAQEAEEQENPFHSEQLVLLSLEFLIRYPHRQAPLLQGDWDILVVDEAHHLHWSQEHVSEEYALVDALAQRTPGVLLLTATPEQLGKAGHYARLRLLDPQRFPSFEDFLQQEQGYESIATTIERLLSDAPLSAEELKPLQALLGISEEDEVFTSLGKGHDSPQQRQALIRRLLDHHGTGRVLFRNTRASVKGFPQRQLHLYPLESQDDYLLNAAMTEEPLAQRLQPEWHYQENPQEGERHWCERDPRMPWLVETIKRLRPQKLLLICARAETALDLAEVLRRTQGIQAAVFHEGMTLIERDRAAAFFADPIDGSQLLIASEIGSEGRNFQFSHHLILFDLPLNPDLLEQRIGRLDRIGQTETIQIHLPYLQHSAQEVMARWYHQGLNAFEQTCVVGQQVLQRVEEQLNALLLQQDTSEADIDLLIQQSQQLYLQFNEAMEKGRDRLLEYNSCRPQQAQQLKQLAEDLDRDPALHHYIEMAIDCFAIDSEYHSDDAEIIRPGDHMPMPIPSLKEDGMTFTLKRAKALAHEEIEFLTWEHPLLVDMLDLVLSHEKGNATLSAISHPQLQAGGLLMEGIYLLEAPGHNTIVASRYLPTASIRIVVDEQGREHQQSLSHQQIQQQRVAVDKNIAGQIIEAGEERLRQLLKQGEQRAQAQIQQHLDDAYQQAAALLQGEVQRLTALQKHNPNVRDEEIHFFEQQWQGLQQLLPGTQLRLDALRVLICT